MSLNGKTEQTLVQKFQKVLIQVQKKKNVVFEEEEAVTHKNS